jgi:hypothetical protein
MTQNRVLRSVFGRFPIDDEPAAETDEKRASLRRAFTSNPICHGHGKSAVRGGEVQLRLAHVLDRPAARNRGALVVGCCPYSVNAGRGARWSWPALAPFRRRQAP